MAEESKPNQNAAMVRNIIVGVATSVIGAATLYFLGINKSGQSGTSSQGSFLEVKEATTKGWKSYVTIDNIAYKNIQSVINDFKQDKQLDNLKTNYLKEMHKFQSDLEAILKDDKMDNSFISMLKRRQDIEKETDVKLSNYVDNLKIIMDDNTMGASDKQQKLIQEDQKFANMAKGILERSVTEVEGLAKVLNDKYGQSFDLNEFISYKDYKNGFTSSSKTDYTTSANNPQQDNAIKSVSNIPPEPSNTSNYSANNTTNQLSAGMYAGEWTNEGGSLYFDNNGFSWEWNDGKVTSEGSWRVENYQLTMFVIKGYNTGYSWIFNLSNITPSSFTMQLSNNANYTYHMVKYNDK